MLARQQTAHFFDCTVFFLQFDERNNLAFRNCHGRASTICSNLPKLVKHEQGA